MREIFTRKYISINTVFKDKMDCLKHIADFAATLGICGNVQGVYEGLVNRELEFETNLGDGIAIPHTKSRFVLTPAIIIIKPKEEVAWGGDYQEGVKIIISILSPENQEDNIHIKLLASLSRKLIYEDFKKHLLSASTEEELYQLINEALNS